MKCKILHESNGRMRLHAEQTRMTLRQADILEAYLRQVPGVTEVKIYDRTCDAVVLYRGARTDLIRALAAFSYAASEALAPEHSSRALGREYEDKLVLAVCRHYFKKLFLPMPLRTVITLFRSVHYLRAGLSCLLHGKIQVPVLDATAIGVSMLRGDFATAGSIMFLLGIGDILDEWTHKKSVADLAQSMSLNVDKVWLQTPQGDVLVPLHDVQVGDRISVRTGGMIPLDGKVVSGEAMVNQASITGEPLAVRKSEGGYVYAGTVIEEGDCVVLVEKAAGSGRYDRIVHMIEESEKLKSDMEDHAAHLADRLVPYSLGATALIWLLTRNVTQALAVLMVDFSCALKLSMPIAVLSAMKEATGYHLSVKGGRFLEAVSEADTIAELGSVQDWAGVFPLFHWSFIPWGFYLVLAVAFGFMLHVRKCSRQKYSEACRPILGRHTDGLAGRIIDLLAVFALLAGTATTFSVATPLMAVPALIDILF